MPNQDAVAWWQIGGGASAILAVADGHGSLACPRSAEGARLAVETAVTVLGETVARDCEFNEWQAELAGPLLDRLVLRWREAVWHKLHGVESALDDEMGVVEEIEPLAVFGTTLLAAVVTPTITGLLQLGDGDFMVVTEKNITQPVPGDPRLVAGATTSLANPGASSDFRFWLGPPMTAPTLILAATDGYANAFGDGFLQVGKDLFALLQTEGLAAVEGSLEDWLHEASEQGTGDDATVGLLWDGSRT